MFFQEMDDDTCYKVGKATIDLSLHTQSADELFFNYFCNDALYSIARTIHNDDFTGFEKIISSLGETEIKYTVIRMKGKNEQYRWMIVKISYNRQMLSNGIKYIDIVIKDAMKLEKNTIGFENIIESFKYLMSLQESVIFEYNDITNRFMIYSFDCRHNTVFVNEDFEYFRYRIKAENKISSESAEAFECFCDSIKNGIPRFSFDMNTSMLTDSETVQPQVFNGITISYGIGNKIVLGTILSQNKENNISGSSVIFETKLDPLTRLLNKKAISEYAVNKIKADSADSVIIVIFDVDDFKNINDSYGHLFGDEILCIVSTVLKQEVGSKGVVGRIGGDEFMMVLENIKNETELRGILRAVRSNIKILCEEKMSSLHTTCSMGTASFPKDADNYEKIFRIADKALYIAKERGKNRYVIYDKQKHGVVDDDEKIINTSHEKSHNISKVAAVSDLVIDILSGKKMSIAQVLENIGNTFEIDAVNIFWGTNLNLLFSWANKKSSITDAAFLFSEGYTDNFDDDNIFVIDNTDILEGRHSAAYQSLLNNNINASVQYLIIRDQKILGMITFDLIGHYKKWSKTDVNYMYILGKTISRGLISC